jgi:hypothetical protein
LAGKPDRGSCRPWSWRKAGRAHLRFHRRHGWRSLCRVTGASSSIVASTWRHWRGFSIFWSGDDPGSLGCSGVDLGRSYRYALRHELVGPAHPASAAARALCRRSLRLPGQERQADQDLLVRRAGRLALRQAPREGTLRVAVDEGGRGGDHARTARLSARRDRLAPSTTHLAAGWQVELRRIESARIEFTTSRCVRALLSPR